MSLLPVIVRDPSWSEQHGCASLALPSFAAKLAAAALLKPAVPLLLTCSHTPLQLTILLVLFSFQTLTTTSKLAELEGLVFFFRSPEEAVVHAVLEARRAAPAILFLPHLQLWWETAPASLRATLTMLLSDLPSELPLLLLATADVPLAELDADALKLFGSGGNA